MYLPVPACSTPRFIYELKKTEKGLSREISLVAQNHCDEDSITIAAKSPTIQVSTQIIFMCLTASTEKLMPFTKHVTQEYF